MNKSHCTATKKNYRIYFHHLITSVKYSKSNPDSRRPIFSHPSYSFYYHYNYSKTETSLNKNNHFIFTTTTFITITEIINHLYLTNSFISKSHLYLLARTNPFLPLPQYRSYLLIRSYLEIFL